RHRVDVLRLLVEHLAVILEPLRLGVGLERVFGALPIHVAQRVNVLPLPAAHVVAAHASHADAGDVELVARRAVAAPQHVPGHDGEGHAGAHVADEFPSRDAFACHDCDPPQSAATGAGARAPPGRNKAANKTRTIAANPAGSTQKLGHRPRVRLAAPPKNRLYTLPATCAPISMPMP